jgi:quercetin dioxygenase-like cupin family protein
MVETIRIGGIEMRFLHSKEDTDASLDMFEMILQPDARMPVPHYHESWDETVYGLLGTTTFRIAGEDVDVTAGRSVFIRRGVVHAFTNRSGQVATCLCTLTPGILGPAYFREVAALVGRGAPDPARPARMKEIMLRYGLVPAP